jgi:Major Facilitator Superfamily/Ku70/Ku80 beta-barrel domain
VVVTAWLADQVDVALLVFLIGDLKNYFDLTPVQVPYLASMTFVGQLTGNLLIGSISDLFGRRIAFQSTMLIWGVASFLAAGAWDVISLMVFRFLIGVGVGGEAPVAQAVLSEIIPASGIHQLNKTTGHRIKYRKVDAETGDEVESTDIIKGYEVGSFCSAPSRIWRFGTCRGSRKIRPPLGSTRPA